MKLVENFNIENTKIKLRKYHEKTPQVKLEFHSSFLELGRNCICIRFYGSIVLLYFMIS